jgi:hypothetical protein
MTVAVSMIPMASHLHVDMTGTVDIKSLHDCFREILKTAVQNKLKKVFIDFQCLKGDISNSDRFFLGEFLSNLIQKNIEYLQIRISAAGAVPLITPERLGETVALNRGVNLHISTSVEEAMEWLYKSTDNIEDVDHLL